MIRPEFIWNEINKYKTRGIKLMDAIEACTNDAESLLLLVDVFDTNDEIIRVLEIIAGDEPEIPNIEEEQEDG